jgi:hypothetical protein
VLIYRQHQHPYRKEIAVSEEDEVGLQITKEPLSCKSASTTPYTTGSISKASKLLNSEMTSTLLLNAAQSQLVPEDPPEIIDMPDYINQYGIICKLLPICTLNYKTPKKTTYTMPNAL